MTTELTMHRSYLLVPLLFIATGCDAEGEGTITVTAYGESFIENGIPAAAVDDGWAVDFSRFEVVIDDVMLAGKEIPVLTTIDLSKPSSGEGQELGSTLAPTGEYTNGEFTIVSVEIEGTATKGTETKSFSWVFDTPTRYAECETTTLVDDGGNASFQITIHADHLLYDSVVSHEPQVLFQSLADADADADGDITEAELAATDIGGYDPGSESGTDDLWQYLSALVRTLGHVDGEGHCHTMSIN